MERRPLLVVDGDNLAHRAYHSTPKSVTSADGNPINAVVGFFGMLIRVWAEERPRAIFVAWDTLGVDTYRSELWPAYQGGRIFEDDIRRQLDLFPDICRACGLGVGKSAGYEADDLIASAVESETTAGGTCLVYTTDKDSYQLVSDSVTVIAPQRGTRELDRVGPHEVVVRFGVLPEQVPDFKALSGDSSDKIPGIKGIGPKAAASLLLKYGTLEDVIEAWNRPGDAELALRFREVTRMRPDVQVDLPTESPDWAGGAEAAKALGAEGLAERMKLLAS